jgi:purine-binding chemotaxis protein CheW
MEGYVEYVTATIAGQLFGMPIADVQDVFAPERLTRVPLARHEIAGLLNVRGRILTIIDMRRRLGMEPREEDRRALAVGIERNGESYGLLIDKVGEVLKLPARGFEDNPINLDRTLAQVSAGVHRLDGKLMVVLDLDRVLDIDIAAQAA